MAVQGLKRLETQEKSNFLKRVYLFEVKEQKQPLNSDAQQEEQCKTHKKLFLMGNYLFHTSRKSSESWTMKSSKEQGEMSPKMKNISSARRNSEYS